MAERTVKVNLKADVSEYTASLVRAAAQTRALGDNVETEFKRTETRAKESGERTGGTLARGINQGLVRNSPLIVAGITAALSAGAPAAIAGATTLFGGIGVAAAAQNASVKRAWADTWAEILTGVQADASVLQKTVADMADQVGLAFREMRPELQDAFVALAPILHDFTDSLLQAAHNALPGIVNAIENAAPVMDGLGTLVEEIGTGLGEFFQILSEHSGAAGTAIKAIGDIIAALLPVLGNLLGAGAELASEVLPPLAAALQTVASVLDKIAPVLPTVAAGFLAFKGAGVVTGIVNSLAGSFGALAEKGLPGISVAAGNASGALSKLGSAMPLIGIATAGLTVALQDSAEQQDKVTTGLEQLYRTVQIGGPQAAHAQELLNAAAENGSSSFLGLGADVHDAMADAKASTDAWWASLSPLQQANEILAQRQTELNTAIEKYGVSSPQAVTAANNFRDAQADVAHQEDLTKGAIDGVTQAIINQYNQALAATNSSFGYRDAQNQVADAQANLAEVQSHLNDTNEATRTSTDDVSRAGLQLEEALLRQATAAGQLASDSLPATASELEHNTTAAQGTLAELYKMRDQMGDAFPKSLQQTITNLEQTGVHLDTTSGQAQNLADTVDGIPEMHSIHVDADLGPAQAKMDSFINKHWTAIISTNVAGSGSGGSSGSRGAFKLAGGGPVRGPGTTTSDSIPALLSNDEHVLTAREVQAAGGHDAVIAWRRSLVRRFANGGPVSKDWSKILVDADMSGAELSMLAAQRAAGALAAVSLAGVQTTGPIQNIVRSVASRFGWGSGSEWNALAWLIQHESGWRPTAQNPTSTAYGLFQFLNSTWAGVGGHKTSDPALQTQYGLTYIRNRYGDPLGAQRFWQAHHWYANGGVINEPIAGLGLSSGDRYMFGESGPEVVTPMALSGGTGGGSTSPVVVSLDGAQLSGTLMVNGLEARMDAVVVRSMTTATDRTKYSAAGR